MFKVNGDQERSRTKRNLQASKLRAVSRPSNNHVYDNRKKLLANIYHFSKSQHVAEYVLHDHAQPHTYLLSTSHLIIDNEAPRALASLTVVAILYRVYAASIFDPGCFKLSV